MTCDGNNANVYKHLNGYAEPNAEKETTTGGAFFFPQNSDRRGTQMAPTTAP